jgi:hypothetical protein
MKYNLGDTVFFLENNKINSGKIIVREMVDYMPNPYMDIESLSFLIDDFGNERKKYAIEYNFTYLTFLENKLFSSKEELLNFIQL